MTANLHYGDNHTVTTDDPNELRDFAGVAAEMTLLGRRCHDSADERRSVAPPMNQGPRQRWDRPFVRAAGFLVTVMVQLISRIPPTSSDSLVTIPPPVIGIQEEAQHAMPAGHRRPVAIGTDSSRTPARQRRTPVLTVTQFAQDGVIDHAEAAFHVMRVLAA